MVGRKQGIKSGRGEQGLDGVRRPQGKGTMRLIDNRNRGERESPLQAQYRGRGRGVREQEDRRDKR